jgi:translation initiation factor IF-2
LTNKKKRVYEVARDLGISSEALVEIIRSMGAEAKSHMSAVDDPVADQLYAQFAHEKEKIKHADELKRERARHKEEHQPPVAATQTLPVEARPEPPASAAAHAAAATLAPPETAVAAPAPPATPPAPATPTPAPPAAPKAPPARPAAPARPAPTARPAHPQSRVEPPRAPAAFRAPRQSAMAPGAPPRRPGSAPSARPQIPPRPAPPPRAPYVPGGRDAGGGGGGGGGFGRRSNEAFAGPAPGGAPAGEGRRRPGGGPKDKKAKKGPDQRKIRENVRQTMHVVEGGKKSPKHRRKTRDESGVAVEAPARIRATEFITLAELATAMDETPTEVIGSCLRLGIMATINQRLERDVIVAVADEFGYEVDFITEYGSDQIAAQEVEDPENLEPRPPVVTVMGHVDHGKTSLLDYIRKANVVAFESGRITQHIGAYSVRHRDRQVTFLDTPGHAAFTAMRARGAQVTDIVVIVVAADDRVMPQTIEAIDHAKAAGVPMVVAINKMDLPGANADLVKQDLSRHGLLVEEFGGKVVAVPISAKSGLGIEQLLDMILLESDIAELKADPHKPARGVVIESKIDQGRGIVGTVLIQRGTLKVGDAFVCGVHWGKVRAMHDEHGQILDVAGPSIPVEVLGWDGLPQAGDTFTVLRDERESRDIAHKRQILAREQSMQKLRPVSLADFHQRIGTGAASALNLILKADVDGSVEALSDSLEKLATDEVKVAIIHRGVGNVNESDVLLAAASNAVIVGFHVRTEARASVLAHERGVDINIYKVIYEAVDEVKKAMAGLLKPEAREVVLGAAEVRQVFRLPKAVIAGCYVTEGKIERNARARLIRNQEPMFDGKLGSLRRFKDDVREVAAGFECGISLEGFDTLQPGDIIESYRVEEVARTL